MTDYPLTTAMSLSLSLPCLCVAFNSVMHAAIEWAAQLQPAWSAVNALEAFGI